MSRVGRVPRFAGGAVVLAVPAGGGALWFLQQGETVARGEFAEPSAPSPGVAPHPSAPVVEAKAQAVGVVPVERGPAPEAEDPKINRRPDAARPRNEAREARAEVRPVEANPTPPPTPAPRGRGFRARLDELKHQTGDPNTAMKLGRALAKDVLAAAEGLPDEAKQVVSAEALRARDRAGTPEQQLEALESALNALEHP